MNYLEMLKGLLNSYISENNERRRIYTNYLVLEGLFKELLTKIDIDTNSIKNIQESKKDIINLLDGIYGRKELRDEKDAGIKGKATTLKKELEDVLNSGDVVAIGTYLEDLYDNVNIDYILCEEKVKEIVTELQNTNYLSAAAQYFIERERENKSLESKFVFSNVKVILSEYAKRGVISRKDELLLINELETYNRKVMLIENERRSFFSDEDYSKLEREREYYNRVHEEIPNILNAGFEYLEPIEIPDDRKEYLSRFVSVISGIVMTTSKDKIEEEIEKYKSNYIDQTDSRFKEEYCYMILKVLNELIDELLDCYKSLFDKDIFNSRDFRKETIDRYNMLLDKYTIIRNYYEKVKTSSFVKEKEAEDNISPIENASTKTLLYFHSFVTESKVKIISDMKNIPYEYYGRVMDLLTKFKNGELGTKELKALTDQNGCKELKDDQVRIVFLHYTDNIYWVVGAFVKKEDSGLTMYNIICKRPAPVIRNQEDLDRELDIAEKAERELKELVDTEGRKSSR